MSAPAEAVQPCAAGANLPGAGAGDAVPGGRAPRLPGSAGWVRWMRFNAVGLLGIAVQLSALAMLLHLLRMPYLAATAIAVEAAVIHNFVWHIRWTWAERRISGANRVVAAFVRFNLTNGAVSVLGNLLLMRLLAGWLHFPPLIAGVAAIACCSLLNFAAADRLAFLSEP